MQPTQHTQRTEPPDLTPDVRGVLLAVADRLTHVRPGGAMTEPLRLSLSLRYASEGRTGDAIDRLERQVLRAMPRVEQAITRGEYGLVLRRVVKAGAR